MILCMCPMCQLNLDAYQSRVNGHFGADFKLPIIFFTQLMGIAFGIAPEKLGFGKEIVAALPVDQGPLEPGRRRRRVRNSLQKGRETDMAQKIGVYVCHCGSNIAGTIDVEEVARWAGENDRRRRRRATTSSCAPRSASR